MSDGDHQEEFDLIGNILSEDGEEDYLPTHDQIDPSKNNGGLLMVEKWSSAPVNNFKARFNSREKGSYSPQKSPTHQHSSGYVQHHTVQYGSYSPEKPKYNSNLYANEFYNQQNNSWQHANPQIVNMNSKFWVYSGLEKSLNFYLRSFNIFLEDLIYLPKI